MEYKIFHKLRQKIKIPYIIRLILGIILIVLGILLFALPIVPGFILVIIGIILLIPGNYLKHIVKIRKGVVHMFQNIHCKKTLRYKFFDIIKHIKDIFRKR